MNRIKFDLDRAAQDLSAHMAAATTLANRLVSIPLSATNEQLSEWLNSLTPEEVTRSFATHAMLGEALNASAAVATVFLATWGITANIAAVDIAPVAEKLARKGRSLAFDGVRFEVTTQTPQEPEIVPEPETTPVPPVA